MTAALITIHVGFNAGSALQTIASYNTLKQVGIDDVIVINYIPERVTHQRYWKDAKRSFSRFLRRIFYYPIYRHEEKLFSNFIARYCKLTPPINSSDDFAQVIPTTDLYITGSDQVWNFFWNEGVDRHYFFEGIIGKKIAYASSIGMKALEPQQQDYLREQLNNYSAISVREFSAKKMLDKIGISSQVLIDPTFMLTAEDWKHYALPRIIKDDYLFLYTPYNIANSDKIFDCARHIAAEKKLKVVAMSTSILNDKLADITIKLSGPQHFLSLMLHSSHVITNSFHGTAFAINFGKELNIFMPSQFASRITDLLTLLGISDLHAVRSSDYLKIQKTLNIQRIKTINFLKNAITADIS
ncbi:MAG: polysaccharide pyruvyl transferase family protein [Paludibacteraceae bacterium]|nr:polysaccharide pyruvyl transferase family protein [Paludibacteraceae bacterium]